MERVTKMTLKPLYRKDLLTEREREQEKLRTKQITRITRSIYAAVVYSSRKKDDKSYAHQIVYTVEGCDSSKDRKFQEFVADVVYVLNDLFPDSVITHYPGHKCEVINIDWSLPI